jgi:hypothetical protein
MQSSRRSNRLPGRWRLLLGASLLATSWSGGCAGPLGVEVTGTVRLDGELLKGGKITFFHPTRPGRNVAALIQPNGSYRVLFVPQGDVKVTVVALPPQKKDRAPEASRKRVAVPRVPLRYTDPETTDLVFPIRPGAQHIDIELTS